MNKLLLLLLLSCFACVIIRKCKWQLFAVLFVIILMKNVNERFLIMDTSSSKLIKITNVTANVIYWTVAMMMMMMMMIMLMIIRMKASFVKHLTNSLARMESDCVFIGLVFSP